jgi:tetratricopeptide (TPR) repeat protein
LAVDKIFELIHNDVKSMGKKTTVIIPDNVYEALSKYVAKESDRLHPYKQSSIIVNALKEYLKNRHIEIDDETDETKEVYDLLAKGTELIMTDKYDDALKALDKATEIDPMNAEAWYWKGRALGGMAKYDDATRAFDIVIDNFPQSTDAWYWKGRVLAGMTKYDDALKALDKATEIDPMNAEAWLWKGKALSALGKTTEADAAYTEAKELLVYEK